jgi:hypothetical protein
MCQGPSQAPLHNAHVWSGLNPGVFTKPGGSAWDGISALYGKQDQLEENLAYGVDQLIAQCVGVSLSALATTFENEIRIKVDSALSPL